tara:strand:+ start:3479 stop:4684 length:1206 start_codon:yes stop_codon:yes gene_type:complete
MSSLNKPRPDYPIYPSAGYYRKKSKGFKKPKGRGGKKPKGKRVGNSVSFQDPNFLIIKAQDEARKARELALAQIQEQEQVRQLQIEDIQDQRVDRRRADRARQDELQIRRDEFVLNAAQQREQLRLQGQSQVETQRYRQAKLQQIDNQGQARGQSERDILGEVRRLHETSERRAGENREIFQQFLSSQNRRGDLSVSNIREQEDTDLSPVRERSRTRSQTPAGVEERRDRRARSVSIDEGVSRSLNFSDEKIPDEEGFGAGHRTRGARAKPTQRFGEFASSPSVERAIQESRIPEPEPEPEVKIKVEKPDVKIKLEKPDNTPRVAVAPRAAGRAHQVYKPKAGTLRQARDLSRPTLDPVNKVKQEPVAHTLTPLTPSLTDSQIDRDLKKIAEEVKTKEYGG